VGIYAGEVAVERAYLRKLGNYSQDDEGGEVDSE
jgi:hypothetical protein